MSLLLPFTLAAILTTDPLGYECVPEDKIEAAFSLGGKGMRLPQTCIVDPCEQTFSDVTLASYSGYQDDALYRDYRQRMSSVCGAPTLWDDQGITRQQLLWAAFDGGSGTIPLPHQAFLDTSEAAAVLAFSTFQNSEGGIGRNPVRGRFGGGGGGRRPSSSFTATSPGGLPFAAQQSPEETVDPGKEKGLELPVAVPLPAPFPLLSAAALALAFVRRLRRGAANATMGRV